MAFFPFEYIAKDEILQSNSKVVQLDPNRFEINGNGIKEISAFDPVKQGFFGMTGFFVLQDGAEYGSITASPADIYNFLTKCQCLRRIHVRQFVAQFK